MDRITSLTSSPKRLPRRVKTLLHQQTKSPNHQTVHHNTPPPPNRRNQPPLPNRPPQAQQRKQTLTGSPNQNAQQKQPTKPKIVSTLVSKQ